MGDEEARVQTDLSQERIQRLVGPLLRFMHVEAAGGILKSGRSGANPRPGGASRPERGSWDDA